MHFITNLLLLLLLVVHAILVRLNQKQHKESREQVTLYIHNALYYQFVIITIITHTILVRLN